MKLSLAFKVLAFASILLSSCLVPILPFKRMKPPVKPDYSVEKNWAALPDKKDGADFELPGYGIIDGQKNAKVDLFFIPPTNYVNGIRWNASVDDPKANNLTENIGCKLVASCFNESCRIYAPRYRTAILFSYFAKQKNAKAAFDLAYSDVESAFLYYMKHYNKGRPIVIAAHSQGSDHGVRLIKRYFDKDTSLAKKLVAAYLIGRPIYDTTFKRIKVMDSPNQTGGYVTWNSVSYYTNDFYGDLVGDIVGVNPLSWKRDTVHVPKKQNKGGFPFTANKIDTAIVDAKVAPSGFLWVHPPIKLITEYPGVNTRHYHKDDYAFFYMNIRENVALRVAEYLRKN